MNTTGITWMLLGQQQRLTELVLKEVFVNRGYQDVKQVGKLLFKQCKRSTEILKDP